MTALADCGERRYPNGCYHADVLHGTTGSAAAPYMVRLPETLGVWLQLHSCP